MDSDVHIDKGDRRDDREEISRGIRPPSNPYEVFTATLPDYIRHQSYTPPEHWENVSNTVSQEGIDYRLRIELIEIRNSLYDLFLYTDDADKVSELITRTTKLIDQLEEVSYPMYEVTRNPDDLTTTVRTYYDNNTKPI